MKSAPLKFNLIVLCVVAVILHSDHVVASALTYYWPQVPLEINLPIGAEQRITIPEAEDLRLGIPQSIKQKMMVEIVGNHLWLLAKEPFSKTRIVLLAEPLGRIIFEIRAQHSDQFSQPMVIQASPAPASSASDSDQPRLGFVTLTRWVVQQLYAPERLLEELPGLQRMPVDTSALSIFRCANRIPTVCAGTVVATPMASWQSPHHFITAIKITNTAAEQITLDPRELLGTWRSAAFVHNRLHAAGHAGDTTVLIVTSDYPYEISRF